MAERKATIADAATHTDFTKIDMDGVSDDMSEAYVYSGPSHRGTKYYIALCFVGNAGKPKIYESYVTMDEAVKRIRDTMSVQLQVLAIKQKYKAEKKLRSMNFQGGVGDVLVSSWGYDQTNVDFYQIVARPTQTFVEVVNIESASVPGKASRDSGYVVPAHIPLDMLPEKGKRCKITNDTHVLIDGRNARLTPPDKQHYCSWGY